MKNNKGYYSEPMDVLQGRLHVTSCSVTLELILNDLDGRRRIVSMPIDHTSGFQLKEDWEECKRRSNNGETHDVETTERILYLGGHPAITIYKTFGNIDDENLLEKISTEVEEAAARGYQVQKLLFTSHTSESEELQLAEPTSRKKRPRIQKGNNQKPEKNDLDVSAPIKNADDNAKNALGNLVEALSEWAEDNVDDTTFDPEPLIQDHIPAPMPDMNDYANLGNAPFLQMVRNLSFNVSDTDSLRAKAVLLISVMDFIVAGMIATPKVIPTDLLRKKYDSAWIRYVGRECTKDFKTAFLILNDERFWNLETTMSSEQGESVIRGVKYAKMDDEFFRAMTNGGNRGKLRLILTSRCQ